VRIEYGTIASRVVECHPVEWQNVCHSLVNPDGEAFFRPDFGFLSGLTSWFRHCGIQVDGDLVPNWDWLKYDLPRNMLEGITLRDYQVGPVLKAMCYQRGIIANCTGAGKTIEYAMLLKLIGGKSICIFETTAAAEQMMDCMRSYGINNVGMIGGGKKLYDDHLFVVSDSAYVRIGKGDVRFMKHLSECRLLAFDEVHHLGSAKTWLQICLYCPAPYRIGLSATPFEEEIGVSDLRLIGAVGGVIDFLPSKKLRDAGYLAEPVVFMIPVAGEAIDPCINNWTHIEAQAIVNHEYRNNLVTSICAHTKHHIPDAKILVLVRQEKHGRELCKRINALGIRARFSFGSKKMYDENDRCTTRKYSKVREELEAGEFSVLIGSVVYDESQDMPSVTDLILASGGKKLRRLKQRLGRGERMCDGKKYVRVYDFYDSQHPSTTKHSQKRTEGFAEEEIFVVTNPKIVNDLVSGRVHPDQVIEMFKGDGDEDQDRQVGQAVCAGQV
jgi:superfamily II DNA or RNA helicase